MTKAFEENRIIQLLRKFNEHWAFDYLRKIKNIIEELEALDLINYVTVIKDPNSTDPIALRIEFSEPMHIVLSRSLCRMCAIVYYPIEFEWEKFYVTELGMLPVFFVDLSTITLIKFWSEAAEQVSIEALNSLLKKEVTYMRIQPSQRNVHYSSMNFIITFGANLWKISDTVEDLILNYLKYSYWISPKVGFSFSTHIIHNRASILYALKVAKTLCFIDEIERRTKINILNRSFEAYKIKIRMLVEKDNDFFFKKLNAFIPEDILKGLLTHNNKNTDITQSFLNAIILEVRGKYQSYELLNVISDIGLSYFELLQTLLSYILIKIYNSSNTITFVCDIDELKRYFEKLLNQVRMHIRLPSTLSEKVENIFDLALENLYPIFVKDEKGDIYFLHPLFFSFLCSKNRLEFLFKPAGKEKLLKFLEFLEKMGETLPYRQIYFDETLDEMSKIIEEDKKKVLNNLFHLIRKIKIAKLFRRYF